MAGRNNWKKISDKMSPKRQRRIAAGVKDAMSEMLLSEVRKMVGLTQEQLASEMGIAQPTLSQLESQDDMQIRTLQRIVSALGGELEIIASLPTGRITLSQFKPGKRSA